MAHRWHLGKHLDPSQWDKDDAEYEYTLAVSDNEGKSIGYFQFTEEELENLHGAINGMLQGDQARSGTFNSLRDEN